MSSHSDQLYAGMQAHIALLAKEGKVTDTFCRLDIDKQKQIVMTILDALADRPHGVNIKTIARDAGVSIGSMYQYFPNRDAMVAFAVTLTCRIIVEVFHSFEAYFDTLSLREALTVYLEESIAWSAAQRPFLRLFARCAYHGDALFRDELVVPIATAIFEMVSRILTQAAARGEIRAEVDVDATARLVNGFFIGVADAVLIPHLNHYFQFYPSTTSSHIKSQLTQAVDFVLRSIEAPNGGEEGTHR